MHLSYRSHGRPRELNFCFMMVLLLILLWTHPSTSLVGLSLEEDIQLAKESMVSCICTTFLLRSKNTVIKTLGVNAD